MKNLIRRTAAVNLHCSTVCRNSMVGVCVKIICEICLCLKLRCDLFIKKESSRPNTAILLSWFDIEDYLSHRFVVDDRE